MNPRFKRIFFTRIIGKKEVYLEKTDPTNCPGGACNRNSRLVEDEEKKGFGFPRKSKNIAMCTMPGRRKNGRKKRVKKSCKKREYIFTVLLFYLTYKRMHACRRTRGRYRVKGEKFFTYGVLRRGGGGGRESHARCRNISFKACFDSVRACQPAGVLPNGSGWRCGSLFWSIYDAARWYRRPLFPSFLLYLPHGWLANGGGGGYFLGRVYQIILSCWDYGSYCLSGL